MAVKDANQNVITDTYATKTAVTQEIGKVKTDLSTNYLPLAGGKITGNLQVGDLMKIDTN